MQSEVTRGKFNKEVIMKEIVNILENMTSDWDMAFSGKIGPETRLMSDLAFESIDVVQLVVAIEERFQRRSLPFEELLMSDGRYVDEIKVIDAVNFIHSHVR